MHNKKSLNPRLGIYLLPNMFTTAGLFAGFYAIVMSMHNRFELATIAVFIAMLMDSLDGRVARLTGTESAFGAQYDSLSDMVAFGIAPALVVYSWALFDLGKVGWLMSFIFAAAVGLRLARFNSQLGLGSKRYFRGLPCPSGAGVIAGLVWTAQQYNIPGASVNWLVAILTALMGLLMVSNFRYFSFKEVDLKGRVPFVAILIVILIYVVIATDPPLVLFVIFFGYSLSGPVLTLIKWRRVKRRRRRVESAD